MLGKRSKICDNNFMKNLMIETERRLFLQFLKGAKNIALVGAGGKTTTVFYAASEFVKQQKKVFITTSTKMMKPTHMVYALEEADAWWKERTFASAGTYNSVNGKISFPEEGLYREISKAADIVLMEADGSKRLPAKAPRKGEPVILSETDIVICVMGMSAVGRKISEVCFGLTEACNILNLKDTDSFFSPQMAARMLASSAGGRKYTEGKKFCVLLNQCDTQERITYAKEIRDILEKEGIMVFLQAYTKEEQEAYKKMANDISVSE